MLQLAPRQFGPSRSPSRIRKSLDWRKRLFSTSGRQCDYDSTIPNLRIGRHTRIIFQGFTGRQATANARESLEWGTNIVGGVKPGAEGEHLGLPVLPSVRKAVQVLKPDATGIYVAAHQAPAAIEEAIEAEIPLIVAVAEHIPLHDILRIHSILQTQSKSRLVGANAPGIISAIGRCRIGFQPLPCFSPGHVGIVAKSGTLSYETVASLTNAGVGQSLCIGVGGDVVAGTSFIDGLKVFEQDEDTKGIILVGEIGGTSEEEAAEWIKEYRQRTKVPKPIAAIVGGIYAKPGTVMGHAGAWASPGESTARTKWATLEDAGAIMVDHPENFGPVMKSLLSSSALTAARVRSKPHTVFPQKRSMSTLSRPSLTLLPWRICRNRAEQRSLVLTSQQSAELLRTYNIQVQSGQQQTPTILLAISVHRTARSPCIIVSPLSESQELPIGSVQIPFSYKTGPQPKHIQSASSHVNIPLEKLEPLIKSLWALYCDKEAVSLALHLNPSPKGAEVVRASLLFDDAAFKSNKRQVDLHSLRDTSMMATIELEAEPFGIVYANLDGIERNIGTIVNGAGLAMNTVDALAANGLWATNFLDTGGKATSETVSQSFKLVLSDPRVKAVFVNIFGGLTLGDMIARGVLLAFKEVGVTKPVVVRIRGTNEKEGQKIIAESGLPLFAFEHFEDAAAKLKELVGGS